jgi:hypothetical protein
MKSGKLFTEMMLHELGEKGKEILTRQLPLSLEEAKQQVQRLKEQGRTNQKIIGTENTKIKN